MGHRSKNKLFTTTFDYWTSALHSLKLNIILWSMQASSINTSKLQKLLNETQWTIMQHESSTVVKSHTTQIHIRTIQLTWPTWMSEWQSQTAALSTQCDFSRSCSFSNMMLSSISSWHLTSKNTSCRCRSSAWRATLLVKSVFLIWNDSTFIPV